MDSALFIHTLLLSLPPFISPASHFAASDTVLVKIRFSQECLKKSDTQLFNKYSFGSHYVLATVSGPKEHLLNRQTQPCPLLVLIALREGCYTLTGHSQNSSLTAV